MNTWTAILIGVSSAIGVGAVQAFLGPIFKWYFVEKPRHRRKLKEERIQEWREMISDVWRHTRVIEALEREEQKQEPEQNKDKIKHLRESINPRYQNLELNITRSVLQCDSRYHSLRSHMSEKAIQKINDSARSGSNNLELPEIMQTISLEISRVEAKWKILD